uniref:Ribokinase n=1 Tax=Glossina pallidipes TaxID=7398 RepID=A0A1B0AFE2_GLOPL
MLKMEDEKNTDVVSYGSINVDNICYVNRFPKTGETVHADKFETGFGGKGANQCVAAARLGANTALVAKVGNDNWGADYLKKLRSEKVNVDYVKQCAGLPTGFAQITVSKEGNNQIIIVNGANAELNRADVCAAKHLFENSKVLLCQLETPIEGTLAALHSFKGISILNAAPALKDMPVDLIKAASILCVNETEAALITKRVDITDVQQAENAAKELLDMGAKCVIITLGAKGAIYADNNENFQCTHIAANQVGNVVDTTGAGDSFLGALAYHMTKHSKMDMRSHIAFACRAAAFSIQSPGTQSSFPFASDMKSFDK